MFEDVVDKELMLRGGTTYRSYCVSHDWRSRDLTYFAIQVTKS